MTAKPKDAAWVMQMGRHGVQVLTVVLVLALVFTMVNVQQFAAQGDPQFGVQWWIAWLLDPMASLTMAAAIVYEGLLADYGKPKVGWLTATKWYAGVATWGMNIWSSAAAGSFAGIWLHSVAPGLVLLLAEAAPRVRRHMADIIDELERKLAPVAAEPEPVAPDLPAPTYQQRGAEWTTVGGVPAGQAASAAATPRYLTVPLPPASPPSIPAPPSQPPTVKTPTQLDGPDTPQPPAGSRKPDAAPAEDDLVARVRQLVREANGQTPGRRAVAKQLGVSEHAARQAIELVTAGSPANNGPAKSTGSGQLTG